MERWALEVKFVLYILKMALELVWEMNSVASNASMAKVLMSSVPLTTMIS